MDTRMKRRDDWSQPPRMGSLRLRTPKIELPDNVELLVEALKDSHIHVRFEPAKGDQPPRLVIHDPSLQPHRDKRASQLAARALSIYEFGLKEALPVLPQPVAGEFQVALCDRKKGDLTITAVNGHGIVLPLEKQKDPATSLLHQFTSLLVGHGVRVQGANHALGGDIRR